ncbi:MAG: SUMF1/EgtB/PvdO family nonheme iron enzyme [Bacteroidales bacterium]|nr:SUMF1/EgtB/PvdO family nonheme iron enzyme [Bacteroidales bacterium]
MKYDIFISCKSQDYEKAMPIYKWLVDKGYNPFFSHVSLKIAEIQGEPVVFGDEIDDALEEANNMIVFTSNADYVKTGYVKDEWRTFVEEQRAGRKSGSLITVLDGINIGDLPIRLRTVQSFTPSNYQEGIQRFLGNPPNPQTKYQDVSQPQPQPEPQKEKIPFSVNGVEFKMVFVEGSTFTMGATSEQGEDAYKEEYPTHSVTLSDYYVGETEVTQALWKAVMGSNPSYFKGDNLPVESVSYEDVKTFITKLNQKTGKKFRLPTEAEWEYAARGGNKSKGYKYAGSNNIDDVAWYYENSGNKRLNDDTWNADKVHNNHCRTHPVKTKRPNELGIYDMSGNVGEWCSDWYGDYTSKAQTNPQGPSSGSYRVSRGGSWYYFARLCRVSNRFYYDPSGRIINLGFRLALAR